MTDWRRGEQDGSAHTGHGHVIAQTNGGSLGSAAGLAKSPGAHEHVNLRAMQANVPSEQSSI